MSVEGNDMAEKVKAEVCSSHSFVVYGAVQTIMCSFITFCVAHLLFACTPKVRKNVCTD